jgi:hypothetical protein
MRLQLAQRNFASANQGVQMLINNVSVGTCTPANDGAFHAYTSATFAVEPVLRFEGTGSPANATNDVTAFIDQVEIGHSRAGVRCARPAPDHGHPGAAGRAADGRVRGARRFQSPAPHSGVGQAYSAPFSPLWLAVQVGSRGDLAFGESAPAVNAGAIEAPLGCPV